MLLLDRLQLLCPNLMHLLFIWLSLLTLISNPGAYKKNNYKIHTEYFKTVTIRKQNKLISLLKSLKKYLINEDIKLCYVYGLKFVLKAPDYSVYLPTIIALWSCPFCHAKSKLYPLFTTLMRCNKRSNYCKGE